MISILMSSKDPILAYFKQCLDSIFSQTYQDFELILVDDGSKNRIDNYLKENNYDLKKIKYIRLEESVGLPKALNIGLRQCKGEYVARMDDDDVMNVNRLKRSLDYVNENNVEGCWSWYRKIDKNNKLIQKVNIELKPEKYLYHLLFKGNLFCHPTLFIKTEVLKEIEGYDENLRFAQDNDLYIRILSNYKMGMINEYLIDYRVNDYRNDKYREILSLTYSLFGVTKFYTMSEDKSLKLKVGIFFRIIRYYLGINKIKKK